MSIKPSAFIFLTSCVSSIIILVAVYLILPVNASLNVALSLFAIFCMLNIFLFSFLKQKWLFQTIKDLEQISGKAQLDALDSNDEFKEKAKAIIAIRDQHYKDEVSALKKHDDYRKEFLGNVSHELKTPIFNVQGYLHSLIDGGIDDKNVNEYYLRKASDSLDRLISIVEDLESISEVEDPHYEPNYRIFSLHDLIFSVVDTCQLQAKEKNIELNISSSADDGIFVRADREKIRQVLTNLIINSIKYGHQNGQTIIKSKVLNEKVLVQVSDNGIGIDKEHLARLFERFYRVDRSRSREIGGTGLGLAIVKHIIEAHSQSISVSSDLNVGTTFSFTLEYSKN